MADLEPRTPDFEVIDVTRQIFNWRLHVAQAEDYGRLYEHGYCYFGTDAFTLARAVSAGLAWDDPLNTDPVGFDKKAF